MPNINLAEWDIPHMHGKGCSKITSAVLYSDCSQTLKTEQMLRIMSSYHDTDELLFHLFLAPFFCKGGAALSAEGPVPAAGQLCCRLDKSSHPGCHLPLWSTAAWAEPAALWGSADNTEEPQECWFFALTTCLKPGNSEACSIFWELLIGMRTEKLFLWLLLMPIFWGLMDFQRKKYIISGTQGCCHIKDEDIFSLLSSVTEDNQNCCILNSDCI